MIHWRWKLTANEWWQAYFNGQHLGPVGQRISRVADTDVTWYEYRPLRNGEEGRVHPPDRLYVIRLRTK